MLCIHHTDLDGRAAASVVARYEKCFDEGRFFAYNYTENFPFSKIKENEKVYIVDCSISSKNLEQFNNLLEKTKNVIWIDHHMTSLEIIENNAEFKANPNFFVNKKYSGAALTYMFLYNKEFDDIPMYLKMISDYDTWQFNFGKVTEYFKCYLDSVDHSPFSRIWDEISHSITPDDDIRNRVNAGLSIRNYMKMHYSDYLNKNGYEATIEGYKALVVNHDGNSWIFGNKMNEYDICAKWFFDGNVYRYTLFTNSADIDVLKIAKKFNGGGHMKAASFTLNYQKW